jgi:hypothetical protein
MSYGDKSWALCGAANVQGETRDKVLALDKVHCRPGETPIWNGSLQDFAEVWSGPFEVHPVGAYLILL